MYSISKVDFIFFDFAQVDVPLEFAFVVCGLSLEPLKIDERRTNCKLVADIWESFSPLENVNKVSIDELIELGISNC